MKPERLKLALNHLEPTQWKLFEDMASAFLSEEFANLRTMASTSGDAGRDAELFILQDSPEILFQYSITDNWSSKINKTIKRIKENFSNITLLVYVTNKLIGANADKLKREIREKEDIFVDIRDQNWFLERLYSSHRTELAAEQLAEKVVDPLLISRKVITSKAIALNSIETQAAFVYLGMQWEDDTREKGLTKLCFEALVRAVLRDTHSENRLPRKEIQDRIRSILPTHPPEKVNEYTNSALNRLTKKYIRHWAAQDEFCLTHEERKRLLTHLSTHQYAEEQFQTVILETANTIADRYEIDLTTNSDKVVLRIRRVLEKFLLSRGESFVFAVQTGDFRQIGFEALKNIVIKDLEANPNVEKLGGNLVELIVETIREIVEHPIEATQSYLRFLSDSYTLLAFLKETPDVQSAIVKMFSYGDITLDTNVVLPLFAENLLEVENRKFTKLLQTAREAGLKLSITPGVLEEVERHMNRSLVCHRTPPAEWKGDLPFLYSLFTLSGRSINEFGFWLETFRGDSRPEDDIADYLKRFHEIEIKSFEAEVRDAPEELKMGVQEICMRVHEERARRKDIDPDFMSTRRLAMHDTENYIGVIERRRSEKDSPLGYTSWWITLDGIASQIQNKLRDFILGKVPDSPVMSPDFLANYLAFGPVRRSISKNSESSLPVVFDYSVVDYFPMELVELAKRVREEFQGSPEHIIQRKVRDKLDAAKARQGILAKGGTSAIMEDLSRVLKEQKTK
jgi:hypothetical protein